jgi:hypothetical protein
MKERVHDMYKEFRKLDTSIERQEELKRVMTRMFDEVPVPHGAVQ